MALSVGSIAIFLMPILSLIVLGFAGYAQSLLVVLLFLWMTVVAIQLIRVPGVSGRVDG